MLEVSSRFPLGVWKVKASQNVSRVITIEERLSNCSVSSFSEGGDTKVINSF